MFKLVSAALIFFCVACSIACSSEGNPGKSILDAYLKIGAALSQDRHSEALKNAKELSDAIKASNHPKSKTVLLPVAETFSAAKDLESARKSYEQLTASLNAVKNDLGIQADEYYCPMLNKSWLQRDPKIVNPYDKEMAACGEKKAAKS